MITQLNQFIEGLDSNNIAAERKVLLASIRSYIEFKLESGKPIQLNFICTHNSRRSQLGQIWAQTMGCYYGLDLQTFSGGVEVTAFNKTAVETLKSQGFHIAESAGENPVYQIQYAADKPKIHAFSKLFDAESNPSKNFAAIMTCSHADENCPFIPGAEKRFSLTYEDPKLSDGTALEKETYLQRSTEIAREMKYIFSGLKI